MTAVLEERRRFSRRVSWLIWQSDTAATRVTLALTATIAAISSWSSDDCTYVGCHYVAAIAPWRFWSISWAVYAILKWWRIFEGPSRTGLALAVNTYGSFLFCASAITLTVARWPYLILSSASIAVAVASVWILMRTGINAGQGLRGD